MIQICIVGVGLIGGSLGQALRRVKKNGRRTYNVLGLGRSAQRLALARRRGALDQFSTNPSQILPQADIILMATPVQTMTGFIRKNLSNLKRGAIITDVGSVKGKISIEMKKALHSRRDISFIGAHPLAGSEKTGIKNARPNLFQGAVCVLAKDAGPAKARSAILSLWKAVGSKPILISSKKHDQALALTSHLPHLMAFALFDEMRRQSVKVRSMPSLTAGSFADATRVAASDPQVWAGILDMNRIEIENALGKLIARMKSLLSKKRNALLSNLSDISLAKKKW
jgi:prephenate dehydrogenase